jgi:hypothetical protein
LWSFALHRVNYDIPSVIQQMQQVGLPDELASRLLAGY